MKCCSSFHSTDTKYIEGSMSKGCSSSPFSFLVASFLGVIPFLILFRWKVNFIGLDSCVWFFVGGLMSCIFFLCHLWSVLTPVLFFGHWMAGCVPEYIGKFQHCPSQVKLLSNRMLVSNRIHVCFI